MAPPLVAPDWTLADVRARSRAWREERPFARPAVGIGVFLLTLIVASTIDGDGGVGGPTDWGRSTRALVSGLGLGVGLGLAAGHIEGARRTYTRHVLSLPRLLGGALGPLGRTEVVAAAVVTVAVGLAVPPLASLSLGAALVLLAPTGPGAALARAADRAVDAVGQEAGITTSGPRSIAAAAVAAGAGTVGIALLRVLWTSSTDCGAAWLGVPCGTDSSVLLALGAGAAAWAVAPIGAAIARSLDVALRGSAGTTADPALDGHRIGEPPLDVAGATDVATSDLDALVDLVRERFATLSHDTRADVVALVARTLDGDAEAVEDGQDVLDTLDAAIRDAGPEQTVEAIGSLHQHVGAIDGLRNKHARAPRMARGAVEKTAATAVRAAGVPKDVAGPAVRTLLTMPDDDWATVTATLDDVTRRFAPETV